MSDGGPISGGPDPRWVEPEPGFLLPVVPHQHLDVRRILAEQIARNEANRG